MRFIRNTSTDGRPYVREIDGHISLANAADLIAKNVDNENFFSGLEIEPTCIRWIAASWRAVSNLALYGSTEEMAWLLKLIEIGREMYAREEILKWAISVRALHKKKYAAMPWEHSRSNLLLSVGILITQDVPDDQLHRFCRLSFDDIFAGLQLATETSTPLIEVLAIA